MKEATKSKASKTAKNVKASSTKPKATATKPKATATQSKVSKSVIFLSEGITGGQLNSAKIETNRAIKTEIRSFSFAKKYALQFDKGYFAKFKNFNEADLTPPTLTKFLTERENEQTKKTGFSSWLFMSLVKRYYASK